MIGIYKITSPSGKIYIGQSTDIQRRISAYKRMSNVKSQPKLYNSFLKYGAKNHIYEIIELCEQDKLTERERYWQEYYNSVNKYTGLNCMYANDGNSGYIFSEEVRIKMSESKKGRKFSEEHKRKISNALKGKKKSEAHLKKLSESRAGRLTGDKHHKSKIVLDTSTGIYYSSAKEASIANNIKYSIMTYRLSGICVNKSRFIYA